MLHHSSTRPLTKLQRRLQAATRAVMHTLINTPATTWTSWARAAVPAMLLLVGVLTLLSWNPVWKADPCLATAASRPGGSSANSDIDSNSIALADAEANSLDASPSPLASLTHLVLVAGHAVMTSLDVHEVTAPENWALLDYQRDQLPTFVAHIRRGVEIARADADALLIFSGGETRATAGPRSEAQSYWVAAEHEHWFLPTASDTSLPSDSSAAPAAVDSPAASPVDVSQRAVTEEFARDSFENLMFSMCRFREVTGAYPTRITVIGFSFKEPRFRTLHRAALRFPEERFRYEGIDPPVSTEEESGSKGAGGGASSSSLSARAALLAAEQSQSFLPFQLDPYSCHSPLLLKKRSRNPFRRSHAGYISSCPEMAPLLRYCKRRVFEGALPWDHSEAPAGAPTADATPG